MVLQVLTDPRQMLHDGDAVSLQFGLVTKRTKNGG
jgi:hypothetical protein